MRYRRPLHNRNYLWHVLTFGLALFLVFAFVFKIPIPGFVSNPVSTLARPLLIFGEASAQATRSVLLFFTPKQRLVAENRILREALIQSQNEARDRELLLQENARFQAMIGRASVVEHTLAGVVATPPKTPYDTLLIDVGEENGITLGSRVFDETGRVLIGTIERTSLRTAHVGFLTSPGIRSTVVFSQSDTRGEAVGLGGGNMLIELPKSIAVSVGENLFAPGADSSIVGVIGSITVDTGDAFQRVRARVPFSLAGLTRVLVTKTP